MASATRVLTEVAKLQRAASETACATMMPAPMLKSSPARTSKADDLPGVNARSARNVAIPKRTAGGVRLFQPTTNRNQSHIFSRLLNQLKQRSRIGSNIEEMESAIPDQILPSSI